MGLLLREGEGREGGGEGGEGKGKGGRGKGPQGKFKSSTGREERGEGGEEREGECAPPMFISAPPNYLLLATRLERVVDNYLITAESVTSP